MFRLHSWSSGQSAQIAADFSPWFEQTAPDTVVFSHRSAQTALRHTPSDRTSHRATLGRPRPCRHRRNSRRRNPRRSQFSRPHHRAESGRSGGRNPPASPEDLSQTLETWGIHTLDQLAQLPETGIAERFGPTGVYLQRLAKGAIHRPLRIAQPEITYNDRIDLDHPISLLEPLLFLISRILNDQCAKLMSNAMAASEITIRLELEDRTEHVRTLRLPVPMRDSKSLLKLLQMDLEAHPPQSATMALALTLKPAPPRTTQGGIFLPATPAPDKLELTLARIRGLVGENNVGVPELLDTHHPHPFRLVSRQPQISSPAAIASHQAFRYFRPPLTQQWISTATVRRASQLGYPRKSPERRRALAHLRRLVDH